MLSMRSIFGQAAKEGWQSRQEKSASPKQDQPGDRKAQQIELPSWMCSEPLHHGNVHKADVFTSNYKMPSYRNISPASPCAAFALSAICTS